MAETKSVADPSPSSTPVQLPPFKYHLLLCADQTKPKCCTKAAGLEAWNYLKKRIKELGLDSGSTPVHRTKANCLRGCDYQIPGPVMLVYPGGYWYRAATPDAIERILQEHVMAGTPVEEFLVGQTSLHASTDLNSSVNAEDSFQEPLAESIAIAD